MDTEQPTVMRLKGKYLTTCCSQRIRDEQGCPHCGRRILPLTWDARRRHADHIADIHKRLFPAASGAPAPKEKP